MTLDFPLGPIWSLPLASVRTIALFTTAPIFGHSTVPIRVRVGLALACALIVAPLAAAPSIDSDFAVPQLVAMIAGETLVGATLGFALRIAFMIFAPIGEVMSVQGGLGAATVLDPANGTSSVALGVLLNAVAVVVFLSIGGHHAILRGLAASFERLPLGEALLTADHYAAIAALGASVFELTARLAAPISVVMLVSNVGVGILGRAIPQLNLMALQLPAFIAIILIVLGLASAPLTEAIAAALNESTERALAAVLGS